MGKEMDGYKVQRGVMYWSPEKDGDVLEGVIIEIKDGVLDGKQTGKQYLIEDKEHELTWTPSHAYLQNRMQKAKVGDSVKIIYRGEDVESKKKGQSAPRMYDVGLR